MNLNGRHWLERQLIGADLKYAKDGNCFTHIADYNKARTVLRTETTINQTREFKVYRHPNDDESKPASWQKMRKGVSDLHRRSKVSKAANGRYLESLAAMKAGESFKELAGCCCRRCTVDGKKPSAA
ncbi:MAG: hypothetical protein WC340_18615 [Kiritimatiellia bacterium]